jgi:hypothetical protein
MRLARRFQHHTLQHPLVRPVCIRGNNVLMQDEARIVPKLGGVVKE